MASGLGRPRGGRMRRRRVTTWTDGMRNCQHCGGQHLDSQCDDQGYQLQSAVLDAGVRRRGRRSRVAAWTDGMRACQHCGGQHLDSQCGYQLQSAVLDAEVRRGRRRRVAVWTDGMRACQHCGGNHLDSDCFDLQLQTVTPAGRPARRRRRVTAWTEGMRVCQYCSGQHLDIQCSNYSVPASRPASQRTRRSRVTSWSEGMRACQHCGGQHLDSQCTNHAAEQQVIATKQGTAASMDKHLVGACGFTGLSPARYANSFGVIELDFTFHDQTDNLYGDQAAQYAELGLQVVVKVSRYATHVVGLQKPSEWWPWLRSKYRAFSNAGILVGLLWQLPPSFVKTAENLNNVGRLGAQLRNLRQGAKWQELHHAFEFRDSSWYDDDEVLTTLARHRLTLVSSHFVNETGWAGNLPSGWHGPVKPHIPSTDETKDFVYVRCLGTDGRSVGSYSLSELHDIADMVRSYSRSVVVFGQGDAPPQAIDNGGKLRSIIDSGSPTPDEEPEQEPQKVVTGTVLASITKGWNRHAELDVDGRRGYLGYRHLQKKGGFDLKVGTVLQDLHIEVDDGQKLYLSAPELVHQEQRAATV
eukprot:TRINITY_DN6931_c0_g1_i2.p1 TRINITY_DN6931_c0_g1~~TRINITY_DN6931_c0_g1_i2.p1  ORF type:complete len:601 (-),score=85.04 TRINITY_DN6931_c0_g1_i2:19-1767(-)